MINVFIDGNSGTTGLRIEERLSRRKDINILKIDYDRRHSIEERKKLINESNVTFLCLENELAVQSASVVENPNTVVIDTSTAHRVNEKWSYGFPELSKEQRNLIESSKKIANVGCHAVGFISIVAPLIKNGILKKDKGIFVHSITGYSGGGKKMIKEYEENPPEYFKAPLQYGLNLNHKHLPEMKKYTGLEQELVFNPILGNFYSGMAVSVPLLNKLGSKEYILEVLKEHYSQSKIITVEDEKAFENGKVNPLLMSNKDSMKIVVYGDENIEVVSVFDNLGKGASGSAIQNMNIALGLEETLGLSL
ncbi:MAG: N-acetyl-gamma-glutamyl-phosphate reductase [Lachnospirales bacterium]